MQFFQSVLSDTVTATTLFDAYDLIDYNDGKVTTDDAPVKGMAHHPATEIGLDVAVMLIGTGRVRARGVVTKGTKLISAAAGGVKAAPANAANSFAVALTAAADGEFVTILIR
ncbi:capsid cement protein [Agrobacterium vitis]|uniref:capsid cement protein n=1 Tax=Agrobacterium vitis TaxID=373 RepID=UPI0012E8373F|nr:capsid cement protein [Agrobacterium vitis]MVA40670.1 hypothetical protein [Agrobacterium vitis]NSX96947.1 DUF2190 family protein [Agrobacterium vitis]NSZ28086.1 DUF2190 family protein [Agrobacterium vitis]UJL78000.1 DUF2190 family protein [Agrobacterium vitis]UJL83210.1 DUF2190 family protein [Agrobacterium vitis]